MRLASWTVGLSIGVALALLTEATPRAAVVVGVPTAALAVVLLRWERPLWAELAVALAIGVYAGARAAEATPLPPGLVALGEDDGPELDGGARSAALASIEGWVLSAPEAASSGGREGSRLRVWATRVDGVDLASDQELTVGVSVANGVPALLPGDAVHFEGRLRSVRGLANPGVTDGTLVMRAAGVDVFAGVGAAAMMQVVAAPFQTAPGVDPRRRRPLGLTLLRAAAVARQRLGLAIDRVVVGPPGVLLHTAVLGERRATESAVEAGFRAAGATHVLSVSGLHLAAIAVVCFSGGRWILAHIPRLPLWLDVRAAAAALALPAIAFYTLLTGAAVATVRSAAMMAVALAGLMIGRRGSATGAIAGAVLLLLGWSPLVMADVSFQLSLLSVLALTIVAPRLAPAGRETASTGGRTWWRPVVRWLGRLGAASVAAGATTAPLVAHAFGEIAPAGPVGNLVLVPLIELVVVPFGLAGAVVGALGATGASVPFLTVAAWASRGSLAVAELFRLHAPLWLTRSPGVFETAGLSLGIACALWSAGGGAHRRSVRAVAAVLLAASSVSLVAQEIRRRSSSELVVTFLDVGQGDAAVIQAPGGRTLLIDAGGTYDGSFDPGERVIEPFLRARGIVRVDLMALSHPHPDHQGGMHRIVQRFPVGVLWTSGDDGRNPDYHLLVREARAAGVAMPVPKRWLGGGLTLEPLGPFVTVGADGAGEHIGPTAGVSVNDASLVLRAAFGARAVLFTGDIEADGEGELCGRTTVGQVVAADVLKVPHHGSRTSSSDEVLDAVHPGLAIMSLGWHNRFRFPRPEVVERYRARGIRLLRTDLHGAVTLTIGPDGHLTVTCARGCEAPAMPP